VSALGQDTAGSSGPAVEPSLWQRFFRPRTLISFAIGMAILAFSLSRLQIDLPETLRTIRSANWLLLVAALLVYYATFPIRALRWRGMLENAGCQRRDLPSLAGLAEIIYLSWFANSVVPAKLGDVYRAYLLRSRSKVPFSKAGGTILAERLIDLAVLLVLLGSTGLLSFRGALPPPVLTVLELGSAGVVAAGIALLAMRHLDHLLRPLVPQRFQRLYHHFHEGTIGSFGGYPQLLGLTLLAWVVEAGRLFLVIQAVGLTLSPNLAVQALMVAFIALAAALLTAPPGTPAGLGYVEAGLVLALTVLGANHSVALSVALLDRSISFGSLLVGGLIVYIWSHRHV
jgi:glycosyltransferase 2 family protein